MSLLADRQILLRGVIGGPALLNHSKPEKIAAKPPGDCPIEDCPEGTPPAHVWKYLTEDHTTRSTLQATEGSHPRPLPRGTTWPWTEDSWSLELLPPVISPHHSLLP